MRARPQGDAGVRAEARRVADTGQQFYGNQMLPLRLAIARWEIQDVTGGGQRPAPPNLLEEMAGLRKQCEATGKEDLIEDCRWGESGQNSDQDYQNCGGVITVLANMAPGGNNRCNAQTTGAKASELGAPAATAPPASTSSNPLQSIFGGILGGNTN